MALNHFGSDTLNVNPDFGHKEPVSGAQLKMLIENFLSGGEALSADLIPDILQHAHTIRRNDSFLGGYS